MNKFHLDFETRSRVDLKKVGAWAYALHPSTEIVCMTIGAEPTKLQSFGAWDFGWDWRRVIETATLRDGRIDTNFIVAHNAAFEYAVYNLILHKRFGWPARWDPKLWGCTLARAAMCGLPLDLDSLGRALGTRTMKDLEGRRLMHQLCKPTIENPDGSLSFDETPAKLVRFLQYNRTDVLTEMEVDSLLPEQSADERKIWELDLLVNRRGITIDTGLCVKAAEMSKALMVPLNAQLKTYTAGAVTAGTQVGSLKTWITAQGVTVPTKNVKNNETGEFEEKETLDKVAMTELLADPKLPSLVRRVVEVRRQVSKTTSTAKYAKALEMICSDHRVRGTLQYHGAHTGRWAGRLLQTHNFPKGYKAKEQARILELLMLGDVELFDMATAGKGMDALSDTLRAMLIAGPGKVMASADFNAIEARGVFWLSGCLAPLAAYARGESPYLDMAKAIFPDAGLPDNVDQAKITHPFEYDIGKRSVLGAGFGMGPDKFGDTVYLETAKTGKPTRLAPEMCKRSIGTYRELYAEVPRTWKEVEAAAIAAVREPGKKFLCCGGRVLWSMSNDRRFLVCRLPSGRYLWYFRPSLVESYRIFCKDPQCVHWAAMDDSVCPTRRPVTILHYWGEHPKTGQWTKLNTYGGKLFENVVQATARDIMAHAMLSVEHAGFNVLLTVHDEVLTEFDEQSEEYLESLFGPNKDGGKSVLDRFHKVMCTLPAWAAGFPVKTEGWIGHRYHK